jgi:hypothetical protein
MTKEKGIIKKEIARHLKSAGQLYNEDIKLLRTGANFYFI